MPYKSANSQTPPGFTLRHTLRGHSDWINWIAWSADGRTLASASSDLTIQIWNTKTGRPNLTLTGHTDDVNTIVWSPYGYVLASASNNQTIQLWNAENGKPGQTFTECSGIVQSLAWSPDGRILASGFSNNMIQTWNVENGQLLRTLVGHSSDVNAVAWSPQEKILASGSSDTIIGLWDAETGQLFRTLTGHSSDVNSIVWSPDGKLLASGSSDTTIRLWDYTTGQPIGILEGHTGSVISVSFSSDGRLLASKSHDGSVRLWRSDSWVTVATLSEPSSLRWKKGLAFHPKEPILATLGEKDKVIRIWNLDLTALSSVVPVSSAHYINAKVVLVGDSGVGKSGLGLVLTEKKFTPTESTHGRHVWTRDNQEVKSNDGHKETRETLLWDLAGQPGYRLIHQLHLNEVAVALVVFDYSNETDPFSGVHHWVRALQQAQRVQGASAPKMKKLLIAARMDRGGRSVNPSRIDTLVKELGFDGYFETSAKEGWGITKLAEALQGAIDWGALPKVTSTRLFQRIKTFLVTEKKNKRLLSTIDDLYRTFLKSRGAPTETEELPNQFETCIGRAESQGLIKRLSFGNFVLLQPELLDAYASALINAVQAEPDGLGSIAERKVLEVDFPMLKDERLKDKDQERLLLIAMIEDLQRHEIVLLESADGGSYFVFPSQATRENTDLTDPKGRAVIFRFEGPVLHIYATLVVRLAHSGIFRMKELWKNAVIYTAKVGGMCGISLHNIGEGCGELTLFFDKTMSEEMRFLFEDFIKIHLDRRALPESIQRRRIFVCLGCGEVFTDSLVKRRRERGFDTTKCGVCETEVSLLDGEERLTAARLSGVQEMDCAADTRREREAAASVLQGKTVTEDFDVFLCHHGVDKPLVKMIGEQLKEQGILPWLDEWELRPGIPWQRLLEEQIEQIKSAAVFVGKDGIGPWQQMELDAILREFVNRGCPVISVLLPGVPKKPRLPIFLKGMTWVDFRKRKPDPMELLIWGVTGKRQRV